MKKLLYLLFIYVLSSCNTETPKTTWIIESLDGKSDTIDARSYWIMSPDSQFIKFQINDTTQKIYNRSGVKCFSRIERGI